MSAIAHRRAAVQLPTVARLASVRGESSDCLRLLPSGDGWSLIGAEGKLVFHGLGVSGRRECLEFAREHGALAVFS